MTLLLLKETPEQAIHRIADSLEGEIRDAFLETVRRYKRKLSVPALTELLATGNIKGAIGEVAALDITAEDLAPITDAIASVAVQAAEASAVEFGLGFDLVNERAVRFAQEQAGRTIQGVAAETLDAVNNIIQSGVRGETNPLDQALLIEDIIGLTERDSLAVDRFLDGLIKSGSNRRQALDQAKRMSARLLTRRAENIARTETMTAANMGTQLGWEAAQDAGMLPQDVLKVWIATEDSRLCKICAPLDGDIVEMSQGTFDASREATDFVVDTDEKVTVKATRARKAPKGGTLNPRIPPAHPSCRCTIGLEVFDRQSDLHEKNDERLAEADANPRPGIDDDPEIRRLANRKYEQALKNETEISELLGPAATDTQAGYSLWGERIKFEASLREKIRREMTEAAADGRTITRTQAVNKIRDQNRYTMTWEPDADYRGKQAKVVKALNDGGWETSKDANFWGKGGTYDGMNYNFKKGGQEFELQFHTPGSTRIKGLSHDLYDPTKTMVDGPQKESIKDEIRKVEKLWATDRRHVPPNMKDVGTSSVMD